MRGSRRRPAGALVVARLVVACLLAGATAGCAAKREIPPGPALPEVRFVPPCDPDAAIALTAEDEKALVVRDRLLQKRIHQLESLLRDEP